MKRTFTLLIATLAMAACGSDGASISIDGEWARTSPAASDRGAVYFEVTADEADTLLTASVDPSIAGAAEIHQMVMMETDGDPDDAGDDMDEMSDEMGSDTEMSEMSETPMTMQEMTAGLPLPEGETVELKPGSYHVMLIDLVDPLETGEEFEVTLRFANGDDITIDVPVLETAP